MHRPQPTRSIRWSAPSKPLLPPPSGPAGHLPPQGGKLRRNLPPRGGKPRRNLPPQGGSYGETFPREGGSYGETFPHKGGSYGETFPREGGSYGETFPHKGEATEKPSPTRGEATEQPSLARGEGAVNHRSGKNQRCFTTPGSLTYSKTQNTFEPRNTLTTRKGGKRPESNAQQMNQLGSHYLSSQFKFLIVFFRVWSVCSVV
jgi:hypothetical protein